MNVNSKTAGPSSLILFETLKPNFHINESGRRNY